MSLINDITDLENFASHPIKAYDPNYTKDFDTWQRTFNDAVYFIRELILSNPTNRAINYLHGLYIDIIRSVETFERVRGIALIPLHVSGGSMLTSLYSLDMLSPD